MRRWDAVDLIGGGALILFGVWVGYYAGTEYSIGSLRRMGPGFFPAAVGWLVALFGVLVFVPALFRHGEHPWPAFRPLVTIIAGGLAFALLIEPFGMVPAAISLVVVAALAETGFRPIRTAILAVVLAALAVVVFSKGLGIPVPAVRWGY